MYSTWAEAEEAFNLALARKFEALLKAAREVV